MSKISIFKNCKDTHSSDVITIDEFLNAVKFGKWKDVIDPVRKEKDKEKRTKLKEAIPAITVSGVFSKRNQESLLSHSGFICIDIDGFNDKSRLESDQYVYAIMLSVSGSGLAALVKVNPEKHKESFKWIQNYFFNTYGVVIDPAPSNIASLRYVTYDPLININEKSKVAKTLSEKTHKPKSLPIIIGDDDVWNYIKEASSLNIAPTYKDYLELGFALANGFSENGRAMFHALCQNSEKYNSKQADRQYDICLKGANRSGITVGTFYFMLKNAGIDIKPSNNKALQIATMAKKSNRTKEGVVKQLVEMEGVNENSATKLVDEVFNRSDISLKSISADPEHLIESLTEWMKQNHPIRRNSITKGIEENGSEVKRERLNTIFLRARSVFNTPNVTYDLCERLIFSDFTQEFNPISEYIDRNRHRNNTGQIDMLINTINTSTPSAKIFIRKWLISIISAYSGHPVRSVLALVGGQNTGKTEWFRRLLPVQLKRYYAESKLDSGKDDEMLMCQKLIVMDDEMGGKSKQDEKRFKELTSKAVFSLRAPYGRANEDFKRLAILCGTSNSPQIINDPTGNTRIFPIEVISIDNAAYNEIDKDELFMELVRAYESGEEWQLSKSELSELNNISSDFESTSIERELLVQLFKPGTETGGYSENLTATEIKDYIEKSSKQQIRNMTRFGIELKKYFGKSFVKKKNGIPMYVYSVIKNSSEYHTTYTQNIKNNDNQIVNMPF